MKFTETIQVDKLLVEEMNDLLDGTRRDSLKDGEILFVETVKFLNGFQADIKLVQGDPTPYVDPVLFDERGQELAVLEPDSEAYDGEYVFHYSDNVFTVVVEAV